MTAQDFFITPIWFILLSLAAWLIRPYVTDENTRRYFLPALWAKMLGALALGFIYQFYYNGGDTFNYYRDASIIYEAFASSPIAGIHLLLSEGGEFNESTFTYASRMYFFKDVSAYMVIRIASFFSLLSINTYSSIAIFFASLSFIGVWALYSFFNNQVQKLEFEFAVAILFLPSLVFWGSGILKDTIALGSIGLMIWAIDQLIFRKGNKMLASFCIVVCGYLLLNVKVYILLCLVPGISLWIYLNFLNKLKYVSIRILIAPIILIISFVAVYFVIVEVGHVNPRYSFVNLPKTAQITAYDIRYFTGKGAGSGYTLGVLDGTWESMLALIPDAINVSLFRPYPWEVSNIVMFFSSLESITILFLTLYVFIKGKIIGPFITVFKNPILIFCIIFTMLFAFAVGVSTFNFGTLVRYKIPLLPFYLSALFIINYYENKARKRSLQLVTE